MNRVGDATAEDAGGGRAAGPERALAVATAHYLDGDPIDMSALAAELGVGRATLYRWVGSREQLLGTILAEMTERTYRVALRGVRGTGPDRLLAVLERFMRAVVTAAPLRAFTEREPRLFVRLATTPGPIEERATALLTREIQREIDRGALDVPLPTRTLAQAIVRISDSFMYAHHLGGSRPEIDTALEVIELLLRPGGAQGNGRARGARQRDSGRA
jgi:AcrR family transcriptional regulator